jgi:hypothetical protein
MDRERVAGALRAIAGANPGAGLQFYVTEPREGWTAVFPNFTPELERSAKTLSQTVGCLIVLLLSADEDDLYCMFFRGGKQLPWFKIASGKSRKGKEREKLAAKLDALAEVCDDQSRARLVDLLAETTGVIFSSDLLRGFCEITGIRNAFTSFDYLQHGEQEGLDPPALPELISG